MFDLLFPKHWSTLKKLIWLKAAALSSAVVKTVTAAIVHIKDALAGPAQNVTIAIEPVQAGTGDPSPDNVRPITGWTGANVFHYGKNFCDPSKWEQGTVGNDPSRGGFVLVPSTTAFRNAGIKLPAGTYTFSSAVLTHVAVMYIYKTTGEVNTSKTVWTRTAFPITKTIAEDELVAIVVRKSDVADEDTANIKLQIERSSSASAYVPYTGITIPITFPTPPGTVYGGTLDVTTGELTVTHVSETFTGADIVSGDSDFSAARKYAAVRRAYASKTAGYRVSNSYKALLSTDTDTTGFLFVSNTNLRVRVFDPRFTDLASAQAVLNATPFQVCYELATPQTYQLTAHQIDLLAGENSLWSDTGSTTLTYLADGRASDTEALNILLAGRYHNSGAADEATDAEALEILLGGNR